MRDWHVRTSSDVRSEVLPPAFLLWAEGHSDTSGRSLKEYDSERGAPGNIDEFWSITSHPLNAIQQILKALSMTHVKIISGDKS